MGRKKKEEEEEQYHVEVITKARVAEKGWEYFVKWAGYSEDENSWEPQRNVAGCERLLKSFWRNFPGDEEKDYHEGTVLEASEEWIEQEKKFFWKNFKGAVKKESEDERPRSKKGRSKKAVKREASTTSLRSQGPKRVKEDPSEISTEEEDETYQPRRLKRLRRRSSLSSYETESSEDQPLQKLPRLSKAVSTAKPAAAPPDRKPVPPSASASTSTSKSVATQKDASKVSIKGKERAQLQPAPTTGQRKVSTQRLEDSNSTLHSLFSAPSSPDVAVKDLPPAPGAPPNAPRPPIKHLPAHRQPAKIKRIEPELSASVSSAIPTKQKLARGNTSSVPKPTTTTPGEIPGITSKPKLTGLSFKKNKQQQELTVDTQGLISPQQPSAVSSAGGFDFGSKTIDAAQQTSRVTGVAQATVASPAQMSDSGWGDTDYLFDETVAPPPARTISQATLPRPVERSRDPRLEALRRASARKSRSPTVEEADKFLASVMPPELAAPMHETVGTEDAVAPIAGPPRPSAPRAITQDAMASRIPKKWKWSGELYMDTEPNKATKLCNVTLTEPTEPRPGGLRVNICLTSSDSIRFAKLHEVHELPILLQASAAVQQFCRMIPKESEDADALKTAQNYMINRKQFTYAHMYLDDQAAGLLIVFPAAHKDICRFLKPPLYMVNEGGLLAALIPWSLASRHYQDNRWTVPRRLMPMIADDNRLDPGFIEFFETKKREKAYKEPKLHRGLRLFKFPKRFFDKLSKRPYCIWHSPSDGHPDTPGYETELLKTVLKFTGAVDVGYKRDVHFIFVHVGSLKALHKIGSIANRRAKQIDLRFYTYGTHEAVHPSRWGLRDIYPIGGCVTFTPSAFLEDPIGMYQMIKKFDEHPLWSVFLPPNVIGIIAKVTCNGLDPLSLYDSNTFVFTPLLDLIDTGKIALLTAPPMEQYPKESLSMNRKWDDPALDWFASQIKQLQMGPRELLDLCMRSLQERHANKDGQELITAVGMEALEEMRQMQFQPALMDSYRRFVIIKARKDGEIQDRTDSVECISLAEFKFRDDAFKEPPKAIHRKEIEK